MRRVVAGTIAVLSFVGLTNGCTLLVSFDDVPQTPSDATPRRDGPSRDTSPQVDEPDSEAGPEVPVTPACDTSFPLTEVKGCAAFVEGAEVCADDDGFTSYPGQPTDLVACSKTQGATCVRHCVACAHLPSGFPDQCDECVGKADGTYCGTEMGWEPVHFRLLVRCIGGRMSEATACNASGCDSAGGVGGAFCAAQ
jgi:hypothetical protein